MGMFASRRASSDQLSLGLAVLAALAINGCKGGSRSVSPGLFLAPTAAKVGAVKVQASRLDFLSAIDPDALPSDLAARPADSNVLGRLSEHDEAGQVTQTAEWLVFESRSRSILNVNICPDESSIDCGQVRLNYSNRGLDDAQGAQGGVISADVPPIVLKNGWLLAFDSGSKNLIAFRKEAPRRVVNDLGQTVDLGYRTPANTSDKNFGKGDGVVLSLVIRGEDMARQLNQPSEPIVTRLFEIEQNKVLVFFSTIRAVHLLELEEVEKPVDFDLSLDPESKFDTLALKTLRGAFKIFNAVAGQPNSGQAFMSYREIAQITGDSNTKPSSFPPLLIPDSGEAFVFDQTTSYFIAIGVDRDAVGGEITGGKVRLAIDGAHFARAIESGGANLVSPPFNPMGGMRHPAKTELCFFEEKSNSLLCYDYKKGLNDNLRVFVSSNGLSLRRNPSGQALDPGTSNQDPQLTFPPVGAPDVKDNRLCFDSSRQQLLSVSYTSGVVVVVADRLQLLVTGNAITGFSYLEPLDPQQLRVFDSPSNSLISVRLDYVPLPIKIK